MDGSRGSSVKVGKGTIDSRIADGEYEVQLKYNRETFDRRIEQLTAKIASIEEQITVYEDALAYGGF